LFTRTICDSKSFRRNRLVKGECSTDHPIA